MTLEIKIGTHVELGKAADELRRMVFIDEQGVPENEIFDGLNTQATHLVVFDGGAPVATARALNDGDNWRIGIVAVEQSRRGQRLGETVMQVAIEYIVSNGGKEILLAAQQQVRGFYEKLGFVQCGEVEVFESGFVLVPMKLCL
jgi:ElaA protein